MSVKKKPVAIAEAKRGRNSKPANIKVSVMTAGSFTETKTEPVVTPLAQNETNLYRLDLSVETTCVNSDSTRHDTEKSVDERSIFVAARDILIVTNRGSELCELVKESFGNPDAVEVSVTAITCLSNAERRAFIMM